MTKQNELVNYIANLTDEQIAKIVKYLPLLKTLLNETNANSSLTDHLRIKRKKYIKIGAR